MKGISSERLAMKVDEIQSQKIDCLRRCPCTFSPKIVQAGAVKGLSLFDFFFTLACERIFIHMRSIEGGCVTGPENILSAGASVRLSARKLFRLEQ